MYSSRTVPNNQPRFCQEFAARRCRYTSEFQHLSEQKGYLVRCRDPKCSGECHRRWAQKLAAIQCRHLQDMSARGFTILRGSLTMPPNATPGEHQKVKRRFLQILNRWKQKHPFAFELHAVMHITDASNAHWDIMAFTDAPLKPTRTMLADAWFQAGGERCSRKIMTADELRRATRYQTKDVMQIDRSTPLLPSRHLKLNLHWSTAGWWFGTSPDAIWHKLCEEWFSDREENPDLVLPYDPDPGRDREYDRYRIISSLSDDPDKSIGAVAIAEHWGMDVAYVVKLLNGMNIIHNHYNSYSLTISSYAAGRMYPVPRRPPSFEEFLMDIEPLTIDAERAMIACKHGGRGIPGRTLHRC